MVIIICFGWTIYKGICSKLRKPRIYIYDGSVFIRIGRWMEDRICLRQELEKCMCINNKRNQRIFYHRKNKKKKERKERDSQFRALFYIGNTICHFF